MESSYITKLPQQKPCRRTTTTTTKKNHKKPRGFHQSTIETSMLNSSDNYSSGIGEGSRANGTLAKLCGSVLSYEVVHFRYRLSYEHKKAFIGTLIKNYNFRIQNETYVSAIFVHSLKRGCIKKLTLLTNCSFFNIPAKTQYLIFRSVDYLNVKLVP